MSVICALAPETNPPLASVTVPRIAPRFVPCANAGPAPLIRQRPSRIARKLRCVMFITGSLFLKRVSENRRIVATARQNKHPRKASLNKLAFDFYFSSCFSLDCGPNILENQRKCKCNLVFFSPCLNLRMADAYRQPVDAMFGQLPGLFASGFKPCRNDAISRVVSEVKIYF